MSQPASGFGLIEWRRFGPHHGGVTATVPTPVVNQVGCWLRGGERPYPGYFRRGRLAVDADGAVTFWPRGGPAAAIHLPRGGLSVVHVRRVGGFDQAGIDWFGWLLIARDRAGVRVDVRVGGGMAHLAHHFLERTRDAPGPAVATVVPRPRRWLGQRGLVQSRRRRQESAWHRPRLPDLPAPAGLGEDGVNPAQQRESVATRSCREDWAGLVSRTGLRTTPLEDLRDRRWWTVWSGRRPLEGWVLTKLAGQAATISFVGLEWFRSQPPIATWSTWRIVAVLGYALVPLVLSARAVRVIIRRLGQWRRRVASLRQPTPRWMRYLLTVDPAGRPTILLYADVQGTEAPVWAQRLAVSPVAEGIPVAGTAAVYGQLPGPEVADASLAPIVVAVNGRVLWPQRPAERLGRADASALIVG
jgi:hypothetical protein